MLLAAPSYASDFAKERKERTQKKLEQIQQFIEHRWDDIPTQHTSISAGFSLKGDVSYQVETEFCPLMDELVVRIQSAEISYKNTPKPNNKVERITVGIGKPVEKGWNIFYASEPYKLTADDLVAGGFKISDQEFTLSGFYCDDITSQHFPEQKDPAWIVFEISYQDNSSVYAHGQLRANSQELF